MISTGIIHKPRIKKPYAEAKSVKEIMDMNRNRYNPVPGMPMLLGIQEAMATARVDALEELTIEST